ncbi:GSCOCG00012109001-RA-CDS, partial [Cotesia congregata]
LCKVCGQDEETWEHVWEICSGLGIEKGWQEMRSKVLGGEGEGKRWIAELEKQRGSAKAE